MKNPRTTFLLRLAGSLIAIYLLIRLISELGIEGVADAFRQIDSWRLWTAVALMLISRLAVSVRWYVLLRTAGVEITLWHAMQITFAGLFSSNFLPTTIGGDVVRLGIALQRGYDKVISTASLIVDRLVGMGGMASALIFVIEPIRQLTPQAGVQAPWLAAGLWAGLRERGVSIFNRLFAAVRLWLNQPRGLLLAFAFTWVHQASIYAILVLLFGGLGEPVSFWAMAGVWSLVYFVTLLPISINGLGLQEVSMVGFFTLFLGVTETSAVTVAFLFRVLQMLASVPGAAFLPDILARFTKNGAADE